MIDGWGALHADVDEGDNVATFGRQTVVGDPAEIEDCGHLGDNPANVARVSVRTK